MPRPKNPDNILIKNKYYPNGLTEGPVWEYYHKNKNKIINDAFGRDVMLFIAVEENKIIVKRKTKDGKSIRLTNSNFEEIIHGRVLSIHSTVHKFDNICIFDIDTNDLEKAKRATLDVYDQIDSIPYIKSKMIKFTGKTSFHIICKLYENMNIDVMRNYLQRYLLNSELKSKYLIGEKRHPHLVNIDLSSNKFKGGFITLHSLSTFGLKCEEIKAKKINEFRVEKMKIV